MTGLVQPQTPTIVPTIVPDDDDPVPLYFLDDATAAGIEDDCFPSSFSSSPYNFVSAMRKQQASSSLSSPSSKLKKLVRFLDCVEIVPLHQSSFSSPSILPASRSPSPPPAAIRCKKPRLCMPLSPPSSPPRSRYDRFVAADLGRAGSTTVPLAPLMSDRVALSPPPSPTPSSSWCISASTLLGQKTLARESPHVHSPVRISNVISRGAHSNDLEEEEDEMDNRRGGSNVAHPVIVRKMWPSDDVRFEDHWGRRLIPLDEKSGSLLRRQKRHSFRIDLWPVEEEEREVGGMEGGWLRGR